MIGLCKKKDKFAKEASASGLSSSYVHIINGKTPVFASGRCGCDIDFR